MSEPPVPGVALVNLGCRVNRVELDRMATELERAGFVVCDAAEARAVVVNTCAVTAEAEAKARQAVRRAAALPQAPLVVATGCVASLFADELAALAPGVVVEARKDRVAALVAARLGAVLAGAETEPSGAEAAGLGSGAACAQGRPAQGGEKPAGPGAVPAPEGGETPVDAVSPACAAAPAAGEPAAPLATPPEALPRSPTPTGRTRPGVKVQDGCDNRCSFCIVWKARGPSRSVGPESVLDEVRAACARGAREVVLTGINLGCYRAADARGRELDLPALLDLLLEQTDVGRLRLSSIEPPDVGPALVRAMAASEGRVAPFLHVCLQSGSDAVLSRMRRVYDTEGFRRAVDCAREGLPELALGTDLIVGFPGETDAEHAASMAFCREMGFSRMHVFRYSRRPGTPAAAMGGQVAPSVMAARGREARELAAAMRRECAAARVGERELVVVQAPGRGVSGGLFDVELPAEAPVGALVRVRVGAATADGTLVAEGPAEPV